MKRALGAWTEFLAFVAGADAQMMIALSPRASVDQQLVALVCRGDLLAIVLTLHRKLPRDVRTLALPIAEAVRDAEALQAPDVADVQRAHEAVREWFALRDTVIPTAEDALRLAFAGIFSRNPELAKLFIDEEVA